MITIIEKNIENVDFKLEVEETIPGNKLGGQPTLWINQEPHIVYAVDTLKVIKAIANSKNMNFVKKGVEGTWNEERIVETILKLEKEMGLIQ